MEERYGNTLVSSRKDGQLAYSSNIYDEDEKAMQSEINSELKKKLGNTISDVVQTVSSTMDGGENIVTFTATDGTKKLVSIYNGSKGSQGEKGEKGEKGDKGEQGVAGSQGQQGLVGPQGASGVADVSDKALINDTTTGGATNFLSAEVGKLGIMTYDCSNKGSVAYASVQDAINSVPQSFQKGGMTIAVVLRGQGSYLNYYLPLRDWSDNVSDWAVSSLGISQEEGNAINVAISQKAFTEKMKQKVGVDSLVNEITDESEGEDETKVPTSKAVRDYVATAKTDIGPINDSIATINDNIKAISGGETPVETDKVNLRTLSDDVTALKTAIGDDTTEGSVRKDIADINTALDTKVSKDIIKTEVNDSDDEIPTSKAVKAGLDAVNTGLDAVKGSVTTLEDSIGSSDKEGTVKGDIKKLQDNVASLPKFLSMTESEYSGLDTVEADTYYMITEE